MICSNCGQAAVASDHFCARCGAPLMAVMGPVAAMPVYTPVPQPSLVVARQDSRLWAVAAHLSVFVGIFGAVAGIIIGPLAIWLLRRQDDSFAAENAREALNFNLSVLLYGVALAVLTIVTFGLGLIIVLPAMLLLGVAWIGLTLVAALRAGNDGVFRYPFTIRFVK